MTPPEYSDLFATPPLSPKAKELIQAANGGNKDAWRKITGLPLIEETTQRVEPVDEEVRALLFGP